MFQNPGSMQDFGGGFGGGGFQTGNFNSPAVTDRQRKFRAQNITPVTAANINEMVYDDMSFRLGENEISQVTIIGTVIYLEKSQTCTTYKVDDTTGTVTVKNWNSLDADDEDNAEEPVPIFEEGTTVRIFAQLRSFQKTVTLNALHMRIVEDLNEITIHMLECMKFKLMNDKNKTKKNENRSDHNSNNAEGFGGNTMHPSNARNMGMNSVQTQVWQLIETCQDPGGMSITEIRSTLKGLNLNQIKDALDFLSNEGHIYSTIDEEHFKSTN